MSKLLMPSCVFVPTKFIDDPNISCALLGSIAYCYANPNKDFTYKDFENRFGFSGETAKEVFKQLKQFNILSAEQGE